MPDSHATSSQPSNTTSGEATQTLVEPTSSEKNPIQRPSISNAPARCEMCDASVPDEVARKAHMAETKHCICWKCGAYVPPGGLYWHWSEIHADLEWNDHAVAWTDNANLSSAMPWVREALEKEHGGTAVEGLIGKI